MAEGGWRWRYRAGLGDSERVCRQAVEFLFTVRCFRLHYRARRRDDNTTGANWQAQDAAAKELIGPNRERTTAERSTADAAYWMRLYFRHARVVERNLTHMLELVPAKQRGGRWAMVGKAALDKVRRRPEPPAVGYRLDNGRIVLGEANDKTGDAPARWTRRWCCHFLPTMSRTGLPA